MENRCSYCGREYSDRIKKTKDHLVPKSKGGNGRENIIHCCGDCNNIKADRTPEEFAEFLKIYMPRHLETRYQRDKMIENIKKYYKN